jgi:hypothetical protein
MKKTLAIVSISLALVGVALYIAASAAALQDQAAPVSVNQRTPAKTRPGLLERYVRENMAAQAVSEISGQPVDVIRKKLQEERLPAVLTELGVDRTVFSDIMRAKVQDLLGKLVESNYLTADQKTQLLARLDRYAERRALMKRVVDKAVTDGTITPDQAQLLLRGPRGLGAPEPVEPSAN